MEIFIDVGEAFENMPKITESKEELSAWFRRIVHEQIFSTGRSRSVFICAAASVGNSEDTACEIYEDAMKRRRLREEAEAKKEIFNALTWRVAIRGEMKLSRFVAELKKAGFAKEFFDAGHADRIYAQSMEAYNEMQAAKAEAAAEEKSKSKAEKEEPTFAEQFLAIVDAEVALNEGQSKQSAVEDCVSNGDQGSRSLEADDELAMSVVDAAQAHPRFSKAGPEERLWIIYDLLVAGGMCVGDAMETAKLIDSFLVARRAKVLMKVFREHKFLDRVGESEKKRFSRNLREVAKAIARDPRIRILDALADELARTASKTSGPYE
jgi:hypothetical protein